MVTSRSPCLTQLKTGFLHDEEAHHSQALGASPARMHRLKALAVVLASVALLGLALVAVHAHRSQGNRHSTMLIPGWNNYNHDMYTDLDHMSGEVEELKQTLVINNISKMNEALVKQAGRTEALETEMQKLNQTSIAMVGSINTTLVKQGKHLAVLEDHVAAHGETINKFNTTLVNQLEHEAMLEAKVLRLEALNTNMIHTLRGMATLFGRCSPDDPHRGWMIHEDGKCAPASCNITNSNNKSGADCACGDGFQGVIDWINFAWSGSCTSAPCQVANSNNEAGLACKCSDGYTGTVSWNGAVASGLCKPAPCDVTHSNNAAGLACKCSDGYYGPITWNGGVASGLCEPAACYLANSNNAAGWACKCSDGYAGAISWNGAVASGTCSPILPEGSTTVVQRQGFKFQCKEWDGSWCTNPRWAPSPLALSGCPVDNMYSLRPVWHGGDFENKTDVLTSVSKQCALLCWIATGDSSCVDSREGPQTISEKGWTYTELGTSCSQQQCVSISGGFGIQKWSLDKMSWFRRGNPSAYRCKWA
mmetsp:Transcript_91181/g.167270  ORF Transcript_91181/g.167270 Transcript_91181/m.167270 type:complete len:535 (+) Transcript_91181:117-1721(+)